MKFLMILLALVFQVLRFQTRAWLQCAAFVLKYRNLDQALTFMFHFFNIYVAKLSSAYQ